MEKQINVRLTDKDYAKLKKLPNYSKYIRNIIRAVLRREIMLCPTCTGKGFINKINLEALEQFDNFD